MVREVAALDKYRKRPTFAFQFVISGEPRWYRTEFYLDDPEVTDEMILEEVQQIFARELKTAHEDLEASKQR